MAFNYLILNIFFFLASSAYADVISCSLHDIYAINDNGHKSEIFIEGRVNVTYDRQDLSIYSYNNTKYANFLLTDVTINFNGLFSNSSEHLDNTIEWSVKTNIEGSAEHYKNKNSGMLLNSELDLKKNCQYKDGLHKTVQEKIVDSAHVCIETKLCEQLGSATRDDYLRADVENYDFGENSVQYKAFRETYPATDKQDSKSPDKATLQLTLNLLADFFLASVATQVSGAQIGSIDLPDRHEIIGGNFLFNDGYFKTKNSSFGDLKTLRRINDVVITNNGLEFKLEAGFSLNKAIVSSLYHLDYGVANSEGKIEINLQDVVCTVRASMNYNRRPCVTSLNSLHFEVGQVDFNLDRDNFLDGIISVAARAVIRSYTDKIIYLIQSKVKEVLDGLLVDFDCEKYRPKISTR